MTAQEENRLRELARSNVEANLGSCVDEGDSPDTVYDEAYTLAFDKLADAGIPHDICRDLATEVAQGYAQP